MTIILPNAKTSIEQFVQKLDADTLHRAQFFMDEIEVSVKLPKFKFDHTAKLNEVLQNVSFFFVSLEMPCIQWHYLLAAWY